MTDYKPNLDYIVFIPARDNSKRVVGKNMRLLNGKPLLEYTLDVAVVVKRYVENVLGKTCKIVVSTNSEEIVGIASRHPCPYGDLHIHIRNQKLAQDHVQTDEVCLDTLRSIEHEGNYDTTHGHGILLQPTSPTRTSDDVIDCIDYAIKLRKENDEMSYKTWCLLTVQEADGFYWKSPNDIPFWNSEYECINDDPRFRQGKQWNYQDNPLLKETGSVYLFPLRNLSLYRTYRMPPYYTWETEGIQVDVDTEFDFQFAEHVLKNKGMI